VPSNLIPIAALTQSIEINWHDGEIFQRFNTAPLWK